MQTPFHIDDPEIKNDPLPQPYRKINTVVEEIVKKVFDAIYFPNKRVQENRQRQKERMEEEQAPILCTTVVNTSPVQFVSIRKNCRNWVPLQRPR